MVAKGAMSGLSFEVDNWTPWGIDAALRDPSGNHIRIAAHLPSLEEKDA